MPRTERTEPVGAYDPNRGTRLVELRRIFNLSQEQLGEWLAEAGDPPFPQSQVSQWETGRRPMPDVKAALTFGVSIDWLKQLSPYMWGAKVHDIQRMFKEYLHALPEDRQNEIKSPALDPSDRIKMAVQFCQMTYPTFITDRYLAALLTRNDICALQDIMDGRTYADRAVYERLGFFLDVPPEWFEFGDANLIQNSTYRRYEGAIKKCILRGIHPERLEKLVDAVS